VFIKELILNWAKRMMSMKSKLMNASNFSLEIT
jgi:hypothetical protein